MHWIPPVRSSSSLEPSADGVEVAARDARLGGGVGHVAAVLGEDALDVAALELVDHALAGAGEGEVLAKDRFDHVASAGALRALPAAGALLEAGGVDHVAEGEA